LCFSDDGRIIFAQTCSWLGSLQPRFRALHPLQRWPHTRYQIQGHCFCFFQLLWSSPCEKCWWKLKDWEKNFWFVKWLNTYMIVLDLRLLYVWIGICMYMPVYLQPYPVILKLDFIVLSTLYSPPVCTAHPKIHYYNIIPT
jgi:hypothetical protein